MKTRPFSAGEKKRLFDGQSVSPLLPYDSFDGDPAMLDAIREGNGRLSISGAQEKYALVVDRGWLRLTRREECGRYILKPVPTDRRFLHKEDMPANEYLTMRIAQEIFHLEVAAHGLCFFGNGQAAYLTRRFDYRPDGGKYPVEDLASLADLNRNNAGENYKYDRLSYEDCADLIRTFSSTPKVDLLKFFRLVTFNYLFSNGDAHLKNFSLIGYGPKDFRLAPAYDLLNTDLHLPGAIFALEKGLFREGTPIRDTTPIGRPLLLEFGRRIGLPEKVIVKDLDGFAAHRPDLERLVLDSTLSEPARTLYLKDYNYRRSTLEQTQ